MKKRKCKQYLKLVMLLFGVTFVLSSCQKDDIDYLDNQADLEKTSKYAIETLTYKQVQSNAAVFKELQKFTPKLEASSGNNLNREIYNSDYGFTINTNNVKHIENIETGIHSFNFTISRDSVITQNVENLLLQSNNNGGYDAYIVEYEFTKEEYSALNEAFLSSTTTKYSPINFDTSVFNTGELSKVPELLCVETWTLEYHSTPRDWSITPVWVSSITCGFVDGGGGSSSGDSPTSPGNDGGPTSGGGSGGGANNDNGDPNELELPDNPCKENCIEIVTVPVVDEVLPEENPCDKIAELINNQNFIEKIEVLRDSTSLKRETGFS